LEDLVSVERALVTGGHGFAGAWLSKTLLGEGAAVTVLDRENPATSGLDLHGISSEVEMVAGDLRDGELLSRTLAGGSFDAVFHLAAVTIVGEAIGAPVATFEVNVQGTWNLLEACREAGVGAVVVASSDKAYGAHDELPYREDFALQPSHPYEASKAAADVISRSYWRAYGLPVAVTRFANLYGGGDMNFSRLVPETVSAVLDGRRPVIRSDGSPIRDFLYIEDAARAYLAIAASLADGDEARGEAFNAGGGRPFSVREVVELICELSFTDIEPDFQGEGNPAGEIDRQYVDPAKIGDVVGWHPEVDLREGLQRTIDWYGAHSELRPVPPG
jgi:CDP-glucose 4,6-dehydratase